MNIHVRCQVRPSGDELSITDSGSTYLKIMDTLLGHFMGFKFDYTAGNWIFFLSTGGPTVILPFSLVDAYLGFNFHCLIQDDQTVLINIYHSNTFYGSLHTPTAWTFDTLHIGAMDNTAGHHVDHYFTQVTVGSTSGGSDLLAWSLNAQFSPPNGNQPFQSSFELADFSTLMPTSEIHVANDGSHSDAYLSTQWIIQAPPPGENPLVDPGDPHIIVVGHSDWAMSGQPSWVIDNWGMDKLIVPVRGSRRTRDAFIQSLTPWLPYPGDQNMFLQDITQEQRDGTNFPKIDLIFTGKKGGILPQDREQQGEQVQQISARSIYDPSHTVGLWFISTTSQRTTYSRAPIPLSSVNPLEPANIDIMWLTETNVIYWAGTFEAYYAIIIPRVNAMFVQRDVSSGTSETLVPGQYYRASRTFQTLLFPVLT